MGKLGSHELNYSSDVDLLLLFDPETLPRRPRDEPGEAAVRIGRRLIELLQKRTADGYVERVDLRLRPSPEVTPIALPLHAAISHYEFERPAVGASGVHPRARGGGRYRAWAALSRRDPAIRLAALARFRSDRRGSPDFGADPRSFCARCEDRPRLRLEARPRRIREVEFFVQIQQMIHGGRDASVRAPATLDAIEALAAAERLDADTARNLPMPIGCCARSSTACRWSKTRRPICFPASRQALDNVARLHGLATAPS